MLLSASLLAIVFLTGVIRSGLSERGEQLKELQEESDLRLDDLTDLLAGFKDKLDKVAVLAAKSAESKHNHIMIGFSSVSTAHASCFLPPRPFSESAQQSESGSVATPAEPAPSLPSCGKVDNSFCDSTFTTTLAGTSLQDCQAKCPADTTTSVTFLNGDTCQCFSICALVTFATVDLSGGCDPSTTTCPLLTDVYCDPAASTFSPRAPGASPEACAQSCPSGTQIANHFPGAACLCVTACVETPIELCNIGT